MATLSVSPVDYIVTHDLDLPYSAPPPLLSRCAKLILIATSNELEEVWVGAFPVLHLQYLAWYTPSLYAPIGRRIGKVLAEALNVPETERPTLVQ